MKQIFSHGLISMIPDLSDKPDLAEAFRTLIHSRTKDNDIVNCTLLKNDLQRMIYVAKDLLHKIEILD